MDFIVPLLVYGVPLAAIFGIATWAVHHNNPRKASQRDHYRSAYGLSLERMLAENPVERAEVLQVRDSSKSGEMAAVRYVIKWDPIPLEIAIQFVRAL
ncbi:hypothetical protein [Schaalia cardiffensis]|nr:hypothetical protein [Schaalia cardiffensis]